MGLQDAIPEFLLDEYTDMMLLGDVPLWVTCAELYSADIFTPGTLQLKKRLPADLACAVPVSPTSPASPPFLAAVSCKKYSCN